MKKMTLIGLMTAVLVFSGCGDRFNEVVDAMQGQTQEIRQDLQEQIVKNNETITNLEAKIDALKEEAHVDDIAIINLENEVENIKSNNEALQAELDEINQGDNNETNKCHNNNVSCA